MARGTTMAGFTATVSLVWLALGCGTHDELACGTPSNGLGMDAGKDRLPYAVELPRDLPDEAGLVDKTGHIRRLDRDSLASRYRGAHRRGWDECLVELDRQWNFENALPPGVPQGWEWDVRGYIAGYRACQDCVADLAAQRGQVHARAIVGRAVEVMGVRH